MNPHRPTTCFQLFQAAIKVLASAGISNANNEAAWILEHALGLTRLVIHTTPNREVPIHDQERAWRLLERRASGEPIQYLLGNQEFCGLEFVVPRGVLIPRPETELLVQVVLSHINTWSTPWLVDVGTGSGCLAVTLAVNASHATVIATDCCPLAVNTARKNAAHHGVITRIKFLVGDLLAPLLSVGLEGKVAAMVANLPYISHEEWSRLPREVRDFEPRLALDGGVDGLMLHRRLLLEAERILRPKGILVLEVGKGQAFRLCQELALQNVYTLHEARHDSLGIERVVCLERKA